MTFNENWERVRPERYKWGTEWDVWGEGCRTKEQGIGGPGGDPDQSEWQSMNYRRGDGSSAKAIQKKLNIALAKARAAGTSGVPTSLTTDGILGAKPIAAIRWFQGTQGLIPPDGIVGRDIWNARIVQNVQQHLAHPRAYSRRARWE